MCKYHLIPADYEYFNFKELQYELNNHDKKVCWSNSNDEGKYQHHFNENDIVYIYFHDSKKITNQILLRARVCKSDYDDNKHYLFSEYCKNELNNNKELSQEKRKEYLKNSNKRYIFN